MRVPDTLRIGEGQLVVATKDIVLQNLEPVTINTVKRVVGVNRFRIKQNDWSKITNITETVNLALRHNADFNRATNHYIKKLCGLKRAPRWRYIYHS